MNTYVNKKTKRLNSHFDSDFVSELLIYKGMTNLILFFHVWTLMSRHNDIKLWIVVKPIGKIVTAWRSCVAGANKCCDHVITTLYKVE